MTEWFRRKSQNIKTINKRDTKEGMWIKCPSCGEVVYSNLLVSTLNLCPSCTHHFNFSSLQYIDLLLDKEERVYISDMKKVIKWYNILCKCDFIKNKKPNEK